LQSELRIAFEILALRGRQRGAGLVALTVVNHAQLIPSEGIVIVAVHRRLKQLLGLRHILGILGRNQGMAEHRGDERRIVGAGEGCTKRCDGFGRPVGFEQHLALQFKNIGIVGNELQKRVRLRQRIVRIMADIIGISAGVMGGDALVARWIFRRRLLGIHIAQELGLHSQIAFV